MLQIIRHCCWISIAVALFVFICPPCAFGQESASQRTSKSKLPPLAKGNALTTQVANARALPKGMTKQETAQFRAVSKSLRGGNTKAAQRHWSSLVTGMAKRRAPSADINTLMQHALRESYLEANKDLRLYADKVRHYNELKEAIRNELIKMRKLRAESGNKPANASIPTSIPRFSAAAASRKPSLALKARVVQPKEWDGYIKNLEERLAGVGDDAQLANIDLQNNLQKAQQILQTLSNVSKMLHDTSMAIIRKIG